MLIILSGLPGTGKTTIARELAKTLSAVHLRIDTIEHAIETSMLNVPSAIDAGYRVGYGLAEDNLRLGHIVIADSVNPLAITRNAWRFAAANAGARSIDVEVICSDEAQHRARVESRKADMAGFKLPTWADVKSRKYDPWTTEHTKVDTSRQSVATVVSMLVLQAAP